MRSLRIALLCLLPLLAGCVRQETPPPADTGTVEATPATGTVTADDVRQHRLTMDAVRRWFEGSRQLAEAVRADPSLAEAMEAEDTSGFNVMLDRLRDHPRATAALREAGLTPREYVLTSLAFMQAGFAAAMLDGVAKAELPPEVNPENVEFVRANRAELDRLSTEYRALLGADEYDLDPEEDYDDYE